MYYSIKGVVTNIFKNYIIVETNNIEYKILVSKSNYYTLNEECKIYTEFIVREDEQFLVGFKTLEEKKMYLLLNTVKGIGVKIALNILANTSLEELEMAIRSNNLDYLKNIPGVGYRFAEQILLDLKSRFKNTIKKENNSQYVTVKAALKKLGFKVKEIEEAFSKITNLNLDNNELLKQALNNINHGTIIR